jgi:molecular chaperone DnaK (HSP70)
VNDPVIGIHLGNLHSSVGISRNGRVEVFESYGVKFIPSIVTYTDDYIFVGKTEKYLAINDPKRVIF